MSDAEPTGRTGSAEPRDELERGMREQLAALERARARGVPRVGWKTAITDPAVQRHLGLAAPVVGALDGERVLCSGDAFALAPGAKPQVEAEIAIRVGRDVDASESPAAAGSAIAGLTPAIELVDRSRPADGLAALLAHGVFHAACALGDERTPGALPGLGREWPRLFRNGELAGEPAAALVPESLPWVVALVARRLGACGERLRAGELVLSGSFVQPVPVAAGDAVRVDCGPLGEVALRLA